MGYKAEEVYGSGASLTSIVTSINKSYTFCMHFSLLTFFLFSTTVVDEDVVNASDLVEASEFVLSDNRVVTVVLRFVRCGVPIVPRRPTILPINRLDDRASPIVAVLSDRGRPPASLRVDVDLCTPSGLAEPLDDSRAVCEDVDDDSGAGGGGAEGGTRGGSCCFC